MNKNIENIERYLKSVVPPEYESNQHRQQLRREVLGKSERRQTMSVKGRSWKVAAVIALLCVGTAGIFGTGIVTGVQIGKAVPELQTGPEPQTDSRNEIHASDSFPDFRAMRQMAAAQDVKSLAAILSQGQFESKLVAANFLAKMAPMPALETMSIHAVGELRVDRQVSSLRLYSTGYTDWLELVEGKLIMHSGTVQQQVTLVRLTMDRDGNEQQWQNRQREWAELRKERADIEKKLANSNVLPSNVNQLRDRIEKSNEILDLIDGAIYVSPAKGGLHMEDQVYHREADVFPSDSGVRVEWHGEIVDSNSVTLLHALAPVRTDGLAVPPVDWRNRFDSVYSLADGEVIRWVRTPFIPERRFYTQELHYYSGTNNPPSPLYMSFRWDGTLHQWTLAMHECGLASVLTELGLRRYEIDGPKELLQLQLGGDWIFRTGTPIEQGLRELERILERELGRRIRFLCQPVEREVIVVSGRYERKFRDGHEGENKIYLFAGDAPGGEMSTGGRGSIAKIIDVLGARFNLPIVLEAHGIEDRILSYQAFLPALFTRKPGSKESVPVPGDEEKLDSALANLKKQTSLEFTREIRPFNTWFVTETKDPNSVNTVNLPAQ